MKIEKIYLDVDGVLADWVGGCAALFGKTTKELEEKWPTDCHGIEGPLGVSIDDIWGMVDPAGEAFWSGLETYPGAWGFYWYCKTIAPVCFLTKPSMRKESWSGKHEWLRRFTMKDDVSRMITMTYEKSELAKPGRVLVDDLDSNCEEFRAAGGSAIVLPRAWNSMRGQRLLPFRYATEEIERIVFSPKNH